MCNVKDEVFKHLKDYLDNTDPVILYEEYKKIEEVIGNNDENVFVCDLIGNIREID